MRFLYLDLYPVCLHAPPPPHTGNTYLGLQRWGDAVECFDKAIALSRDYSFAAANKALAMFQLGKREEAIRCVCVCVCSALSCWGAVRCVWLGVVFAVRCLVGVQFAVLLGVRQHG